MSYIDELRERFLSAEERFGRINEAGKQYRERLMGLMSRIEEEIRCRRDVERQQAKEIERLARENEELRTMLMGLLQAVESGDPNSLDDTLGVMDTKVAALIGEGQGAPTPAPEQPAVADEDTDGDGEADARQGGLFAAGDMMASPVAATPFADEPDDVPQGEGSLPENAFADEDDPVAIAEDDTDMVADLDALDEGPAVTEEPHPDSGGEPAGVPSDADAAAPATVAATEIAEFFGAGSEGGEEILPAYAHPAGDWDDFLNEDTPPGEVPDGAAASGDPDAGSIRDLMDRVKSEVEGEAGATDAEDDDNGGAAAAG